MLARRAGAKYVIVGTDANVQLFPSIEATVAKAQQEPQWPWFLGEFTAPSCVGSRPLAPARHPEVVAQLFGKKTAAAEALPKGWRKVPSRSRPGEFSYENIKTKQVYDKLPVGAFYDDERDTVSRPAWKPPTFGEDDMTDAERSGFTADGRDLAAAGSEIYYAVIPFLLFAFLYSNGIFSFGYDNGNF